MRPVRVRRFGAILAGLVLVAAVTVSAVPVALAVTTTSIVVDSTADTVANDGSCTLREAITAANTDSASGNATGECPAGSSSASDTITFSVSGTITLASALPDITSDVTIDGGGTITVDGNHAVEPFAITSGTVTIDRLTIINGSAAGIGGGGIANSGTLTVSRSTISGNSAGTYGGGIVSNGTLTVSSSTITGNTVPGQGGGIANLGGTLSVRGSTISGNSAVGDAGGGIYTDGTATVSDSTISGNSSTLSGGGIFNAGTATITNSIISGNDAHQDGGGIFNADTLTVTGSTIDSNIASVDSGGGIFNGGTRICEIPCPMTVSNTTIYHNDAGNGGGGIDNEGDGTLTNATITANSAAAGGGLIANGGETVVNSLIAGDGGGDPVDVSGTLEFSTANLIGIPTGKTLGDILVVDGAGKPVLAAHGGPTKTVALALVAGNPAIDTGDSATCAAAPVNAMDQRGFPRPTACDIGAYEAQAPTIAAHANVTGSPTSSSGGTVTFTAPAGTNEQGGTATVACLPASGSTFPVGSTTVTCTATDAVGHTASTTFQVVLGAFVTAAPSVRPTVCECDTATLSADRSTTPGLPLVLAILGLLGLVALRPIRSIRRR